MDSSLLDTDILTEIFKGRNHQVAVSAADYLKDRGQFAISAMTRFEVVRGLRHKRATTLLERFDLMCSRMLVISITDQVLDRAADLIIAATALVHRLTLITGNAAHFQWIDGLSLADWRKT